MNEYSLSHADTKDGNLPRKMTDSILTDARVGERVARARADDQLRWILRNEFVQSYLVIPIDRDSRTFEHEILIDVPGEGVIIIDHNKI